MEEFFSFLLWCGWGSRFRYAWWRGGGGVVGGVVGGVLGGVLGGVVVGGVVGG